MNAAKRKGTAWETALVDYLRAHGYPHVERRAQSGTNDRGDIAGIPGVVLEAKACKTLELAEWMKELAVEIRNADADTGAVIVKRRQAPAGDAYAVLPLWRFVQLLKEAGR